MLFYQKNICTRIAYHTKQATIRKLSSLFYVWYVLWYALWREERTHVSHYRHVTYLIFFFFFISFISSLFIFFCPPIVRLAGLLPSVLLSSVFTKRAFVLFRAECVAKRVLLLCCVIMHRHGHWLCWMYMGANISLKRKHTHVQK